MSDDFEKNRDGGNNENDNSMGGLFDKLNSMSGGLSSSSESAAPSSESAADAGKSESNTGGEKSPDIFMPEDGDKKGSKEIDKSKEKKIGKIDIGDLKSAFDTGKQPIVKPVEVKAAPHASKETTSAKTEAAKKPAKPPLAPVKVDLPKKAVPAKSAPPASKPESKPPVPAVPAPKAAPASPKAAPASPKAAPTVQSKEAKAPESKPLVQRVSGLTAKLPTLFKRNKVEATADISTSTKPAASAPVSDANAPATPVKSAEAKPKTPAVQASPAVPVTRRPVASNEKPPLKTPATSIAKTTPAETPTQPKAPESRPLAQKVSGLTAKIPALFKRDKENSAANAPAAEVKPPAKPALPQPPKPTNSATAKPPAPPASAPQSQGKRFLPESAAPAPQRAQLENKYAPTIQPVVKRRDIKKKQKMSGGKKAAIAVAIVAGLAAIGAGLWSFLFKDMLAAQSSDPVFVTSVGQLAGMDMGTNPRYSAVVDPQKSVDVTKDDTKQIAEYFVDVGDEVQESTPLFSYNTEDMQLSLTQAEIDLEGIANRITTLKSQIADLEKQREKAPADEKPSYTLQISTAQLDVKTEEYNSSLKSAEIDKIKLDIENAEVLSPAAGVIKEMNKSAQTDPMTGQPKPFISIVARGDYRIRGTVTELNIADITIGQSVIVHSRVNPDETWQGTVESIDMENPVSGNGNDMMVYNAGGDQSNQSSKYYFYVVLQDYTGLMLGQHVYLEPDTGIDTTDRTGIWLPSFYIAHDESMDFVWARDPETEKLVKKEVIIGEFDDESDLCQIISGVVPEDYIAYPNDEYIEGMPTTIDRYSAPDADPNAPIDMPEGDAGIDTGMIGTPEGDDFTDDGLTDDGLTDDGMTDNGLNDDVTITTPEGGDEYGYYDDDGNFVPMENPDAGITDDGITFYDESGLG